MEIAGKLRGGSRTYYTRELTNRQAVSVGSGRINSYTIEKGGAKKLIYQAPWYENGRYRGLVEVSLPLPDTLPHFVRDSRD